MAVLDWDGTILNCRGTTISQRYDVGELVLATQNAGYHVARDQQRFSPIAGVSLHHFGYNRRRVARTTPLTRTLFSGRTFE